MKTLLTLMRAGEQVTARNLTHFDCQISLGGRSAWLDEV